MYHILVSFSVIQQITYINETCFIFPRIPSALISYRFANPVFFPFEFILLIFGTLRYPCLSFFFILSGVFSASYLILKQLVSCGESRPGSPNPPFHLSPGSLGLSVTKKALSHFGDFTRTGQRRRKKQSLHRECLQDKEAAKELMCHLRPLSP